MAYRLTRKHITPNIATKLFNDLTLTNSKSQAKLSFYRKLPDYVYVPLYYARILIQFPNIHYMTEINNNKLDMSINKRKLQAITEIDVNITPYPYQQELINEAKQQLDNTGSVMINAYTSFGKSVVLLHLIKYTKCITLILLTRETFLTQIGYIMMNRSNATVWIPGNKTKGCLPCLSKHPPLNPNVIICMMGRINYLPQELLDSIGTLVIDEAHLACTPTCIEPILSSRPRYVILLTATPNRDDGMHSIINLLSGPSRIIRTMEKPVIVIRWATNINIPIYNTAKGNADWSEHMKYLANDTNRNILIRDFVCNLVDPTKSNTKIAKIVAKHSHPTQNKLIGMTWRAETHRENIIGTFSELSDSNITVDYLDADKKQYNDCDFLIGTFGKIGVGFDQSLFCRDFDGVIINIALMMASTKSYNVLKQARGRACRAEQPIFVYMVDNNPISENHWKTCRKYLLEEPGTKIVHYRGEKQ